MRGLWNVSQKAPNKVGGKMRMEWSGVLHQGEEREKNDMWRMSQSPIKCKRTNAEAHSFPTQGHTMLFHILQLKAEDMGLRDLRGAIP